MRNRHHDKKARAGKGGHPELEPEVADTITFVVVWPPRGIPDLSLTLDSYDLAVGINSAMHLQSALGVKNIFNKEPPFGPYMNPNDYGPGWYGSDDSWGRYVHTSLQFTFEATTHGAIRVVPPRRGRHFYSRVFFRSHITPGSVDLVAHRMQQRGGQMQQTAEIAVHFSSQHEDQKSTE